MAPWKGIVGESFTAQEFKDYVASLKFQAWRPQFVVVHNTAAPKLSEWHSVPGKQRMLNLEAYYRDQQKWSGGPHLFVADDLIWAFTPLTVPGVHSPSWNAIAWGMEIVGDYSVEEFTGGVKENAIAALAVLHNAMSLSPQTLRLHKEDPRTTHDCPGKNVVKAELQALVENALQQMRASAVRAAG